MEMNPKVFISHASEDKPFVLKFATRLRENGVDAWVDRWEMLPGDSLVDKIFEEGIKNAQAVIIVLSKSSVGKRWVKEELNAAFLQRIQGKTKLIPVVIDNCEIPSPLQSTLWEKINNTDSFDTEFSRILSAIYGQTEKPPLGQSPRYAQQQIPLVSGLTKVDSLVMKIICDTSLRIGQPWINANQIKEEITSQGISEDEMYESIDVLSNRYYVKGNRTFGSKGLDFFRITSTGFQAYAKVFIPNYSRLLADTLFAVINHDLDDNHKIATHLNQPEVLIDYLLDILKNQGFIKTTETMGGNIYIHEITIEGKRAARNLSNSL